MEQNQSLIDNIPNDNTPNDNTSNNNSSNFNSGVVHPEKSLEDKEMDVFLVDVNKKSIGENIRRNNRKKKLQRESAIQNIIFEQSCEIETVDVENGSDGLGA